MFFLKNLKVRFKGYALAVCRMLSLVVSPVIADEATGLSECDVSFKRKSVRIWQWP